MNEKIAISLLGAMITLSAAGALAAHGKWWWSALCVAGFAGFACYGEFSTRA